MGDVEYTVQREIVVPLDETDGAAREGSAAWVDVATVAVPPKSKRTTVIRRALESAGITLEAGQPPLMLRVLDVPSAEIVPVRVKQVEPELEIG